MADSKSVAAAVQSVDDSHPSTVESTGLPCPIPPTPQKAMQRMNLEKPRRALADPGQEGLELRMQTEVTWWTSSRRLPRPIHVQHWLARLR